MIHTITYSSFVPAVQRDLLNAIASATFSSLPGRRPLGPMSPTATVTCPTAPPLAASQASFQGFVSNAGETLPQDLRRRRSVWPVSLDVSVAHYLVQRPKQACGRTSWSGQWDNGYIHNDRSILCAKDSAMLILHQPMLRIGCWTGPHKEGHRHQHFLSSCALKAKTHSPVPILVRNLLFLGIHQPGLRRFRNRFNPADVLVCACVLETPRLAMLVEVVSNWFRASSVSGEIEASRKPMATTLFGFGATSVNLAAGVAPSLTC